MSVAVDLAGGVWTYAEAGRELGISRQAVAQLAHRGVLPRVSLRGRDYVPVAAVRERRREMIREGLLPTTAAER